eukprot:6585991-Pyramimonas_sp.AAC.1
MHGRLEGSHGIVASAVPARATVQGHLRGGGSGPLEDVARSPQHFLAGEAGEVKGREPFGRRPHPGRRVGHAHP